jgi:ATP-dependent DNA helicase RecG
MSLTLDSLIHLKESENKIEFKEAKGGNFSYDGGTRATAKERRRCIIGYVTAFANEGGGYLVFGVSDKHPHQVVGSNQCEDALGKLEQDIYRDTKIRIITQELIDKDGKRVLVLKIPSRPPGKVYKFEDVPLMRVGEDLVPMSEEQYLKIIQEQEPDFSEKVCDGLTIGDLDERAILRMKEAYSQKQSNPLFLTLSNEQALVDLGLIFMGKVTYASLILLGKEEAIKKHLPQASINLEYRNFNSQITFDDRHIYHQPYFITIDDLWDRINLRNGKVPVQEGPFIFDIPFFNKEVIREALNNAVAHRDYRRTSEIVIKQSPEALFIISPGGFPIGVNLNNLLTVSSTPRNRLLADVLAKTGVVERSGQGIDKIFFQSIAEAKGQPDFSFSDDFQVELRLSSVVRDKAFALFINKLQKDRKGKDKLSVLEIITLDAVREGVDKDKLDKTILEKLLREELIEKVGKTLNQKLRLSIDYYSFSNQEASYTNDTPVDDAYIYMKINQLLTQFGKAKIGKFVDLFAGKLTREQVKTVIYNLTKSKILEHKGKGAAREYFLGKAAINSGKMLQRAMKLGLEEMRKRGELGVNDGPIQPQE